MVSWASLSSPLFILSSPPEIDISWLHGKYAYAILLDWHHLVSCTQLAQVPLFFSRRAVLELETKKELAEIQLGTAMCFLQVLAMTPASYSSPSCHASVLLLLTLCWLIPFLGPSAQMAFMAPSLGPSTVQRQGSNCVPRRLGGRVGARCTGSCRAI